MKIVFTICSNNYLSQAKTLGDSITKHNPDYKFIIGLCDKKNDLIDYSFFNPYDIIEVEDIGIKNFEWMIYNYYIIELNTAIKPYFFQHFLKKYNDVEVIMYIDPDIRIYNNLSFIEKELANNNAILTPHILSPIAYDQDIPRESTFLNFGIYNLGFIGVRPSSETNKMLQWWADKLAVEGFDRVYDGLFVDQLPMNLAPIFFENILVSKNPGYNFAYWNFHERTISTKNNTYYVNEKYPLVFFHFSSFKPSTPIILTTKQTRFEINEGTLLYKLYADYADSLIQNKYNELKTIPCYYSILRDDFLQKQKLTQNKEKTIIGKLKKRLRHIYK